MSRSFKNYNRPMGPRVIDKFYMDQILIHLRNNKEDSWIIDQLQISKESFEKYKKLLYLNGLLK